MCKLTKTEDINKVFTEAHIEMWERETGCIHPSKMNRWQKLRRRFKRAYLAFKDLI